MEKWFAKYHKLKSPPQSTRICNFKPRGILGCAQGRVKINEVHLRTKLILTSPDMLIYYGKLKPEYMKIFEEYGVDYKVFIDFQRISRGKEVA